MDLFVAGAGPAYTDRVGATGAAYLVELAGTRLLFDLGQGSFPRLASVMDPADLDAVLVSHLHPDHFIDLVPLRHYLLFECQPPRRVSVRGPADLERRLDDLHGEKGFSAEALDVRPLAAGDNEIGGVEVEARLVTHTNDSYAFRVDAGDRPGLVYSGDCGRGTDLVPLVRPGDTLLCEVSFGEGPVPDGAQHLDAPAVASLASTTRPGRLLLTHIQMGFDPDRTVAAVRAAWDGDVRFVWPGDRLTL
jgi:ribonuclease BN (tRNA processing enzyme)